MSMKVSALCSLVTGALLLSAASQADANSRIHIVNDYHNKIEFKVFNGGDSTCDSGKNKSIGPNNSENVGCAGDGKHRCKVRILALKDGGSYTKACDEPSLYNTCGGKAIIVHNGQTLTVSDTAIECSIE